MNQLLMISLLIIRMVVPVEECHEPDLKTSMMVVSDPHYYDPSLGLSGKAFESYLKNNGKLIRESDELIKEAIQVTISSGVEMLLIPGDLTKDGSLASHLGLANHLTRLTDHGIKVYVVPGNHDVHNGSAHSYEGDSLKRAANIGPEKFSEIYGPYGYGEAIYRDSGSLSYISEPMEGLWIIGLDACLYSRNDSLHHAHTGGEFSIETLKWLEGLLLTDEAALKTKVVLMHHGILEHFRTQKKYFGEYVLEDHKRLSRWLACLGVRTVFTGHYHANDITLQRWKDGSFLYDIETGSLVTYPCPLRKIDIRGDSMFIETQHIQSIPAVDSGFQEYARTNVRDGAAGMAERTMIKMKLNSEDAGYLALQLGDLFANHCMGDEIPTYPLMNLEEVSLWGRLMIYFRRRLIKGISNDLSPADNKLTISLQSGEYF